jgi:hypothetical protein
MKPNIEALQQVVRVLKTVEPKDFCLGSWTCGTAACAIGHAAQDPWFIERGLQIGVTSYNYDGDEERCPVQEDGNSGWPAVGDFFNLSQKSAFYLFNELKYNHDVTVQDVITRIEEFIQAEQLL